MARYVLGDVHGAYRALCDVLERASFSFEDDELYFVGDVCDRYPETYETLDLMMGIRHFYPVLGNHDLYLLDYLLSGAWDDFWYAKKGGEATVSSFARAGVGKRRLLEMASFLSSWPYIRLFPGYVMVHGGLPADSDWDALIPDMLFKTVRDDPVFSDDPPPVTVDRSLVLLAHDGKKRKDVLKKVKKLSRRILVGHSPLVGKDCMPLVSTDYGIVDLDTGAGWGMRLTMMDLDTGQFIQSRLVSELYQ